MRSSRYLGIHEDAEVEAVVLDQLLEAVILTFREIRIVAFFKPSVAIGLAHIVRISTSLYQFCTTPLDPRYRP